MDTQNDTNMKTEMETQMERTSRLHLVKVEKHRDNKRKLRHNGDTIETKLKPNSNKLETKLGQKGRRNGHKKETNWRRN